MKQRRRKATVQKQAVTIRIDQRLADEVAVIADTHLWTVSKTIAVLLERAVAHWVKET